MYNLCLAGIGLFFTNAALLTLITFLLLFLFLNKEKESIRLKRIAISAVMATLVHLISLLYLNPPNEILKTTCEIAEKQANKEGWLLIACATLIFFVSYFLLTKVSVKKMVLLFRFSQFAYIVMVITSIYIYWPQ